MGLLVFTLNILFSAYYLLLALRAVLPWIPHDKTSPFISPVYRLTDPLLVPIRKGLPPLKIGIDVSPFAAILLLWLAHQVIVNILIG